MKIEFKLEDTTHQEVFHSLTDMLVVIDREYLLSYKVWRIMELEDKDMPELVEETHEDSGFEVIFKYIKSTHKISLYSKRINK